MDAYFKDSIAHWLTVAKIAMFGGPDTMDNSGAPHFVFQAGEPSVEFPGTLKGIHALQCIRSDTNIQSWA